MSNGGMNHGIDFTVDINNLYREENVTDMQVASIRKLVPVSLDGTEDTAREALFIGHSQLMSPNGPLPLQCELKAKTLEEAIQEFPAAMNQAVERLIEEAKKLQAEEASRIVVPGGQQDRKIIY
ncbi:cytoplasmic protein [Desulfonema ishimotonii]|uniref:Cytoplasmic protein n=1 Tax=Desulfonema ishimotonii TaxID=45657 RepID=A0A401G0T5_9BACT|nr:cytoplasmic protein [Desulfonema ishimotonii]GBC62793.1 cytoplasmic protein [Desulfonema ishimotonii]